MQHIRVRKDLPSGTIVIDRQDRRNALSSAVVSELHAALEDFHGERRVRAVILTGVGNTFCSGSDLHELHESFDDSQVEQHWYEQVSQMQALLEFMLRFPKPIVAAVNGSVAGCGAALMLACDVIIAGESAALSAPEAKRGLVAGLTAPLLAFRAGASRAHTILLTGEPISSEQCRVYGIFDEAVADDLVWARAHEVAKTLALSAPSSHQLTKNLLNETIGEALLTQLSIGAANTAAARSTDAAKEGVAAFIEKRAPHWD